jgi:hypothetical protein
MKDCHQCWIRNEHTFSSALVQGKVFQHINIQVGDGLGRVTSFDAL